MSLSSSVRSGGMVLRCKTKRLSSACTAQLKPTPDEVAELRRVLARVGEPDGNISDRLDR